MSNIHQMLGMTGGSFSVAEKIALDMIAHGNNDVWLDFALLKHAQGDTEGSRRAIHEYEKSFPDCPRARWAETWFRLHDGDLKGGFEHIEVGRVIGTLGNAQQFQKFTYPRWNGASQLQGKSVLLYGEGGAGDQIMGLRSASWLKERGADVVVACSKSLLGLFKDQGHKVIDSDQAHAFGADYWLPMMSSFGALDRDWGTLWTGPYIQHPKPEIWNRIIRKAGKMRVGLRWRGNPEFEHEQLRWFPPELLFKSTEIGDIDFYSLQKGDPQTELPPCVTDLEPLLGDWRQTAAAISELDLVITSCTSIAHLSAAMGKPTWVVVPVMPYYPWARPGRTSHWYPTVTLFRQRCYGQWVEAFQELYECLERRVHPTGVIEIGPHEFRSRYNAAKLNGTYYMSGDEIASVAALIEATASRNILEIGINRGETARKILDLCPSIRRYTGIEIDASGIESMNPHQRGERTRAGSEVGKDVLDDARTDIFIAPNGSKEFVQKEHYDLVLIDGNHAYEWVKHDTELAFKLGARVVVWHDYGTEPGVTRAVNEAGTDVIRILGSRIAYRMSGGRTAR